MILVIFIYTQHIRIMYNCIQKNVTLLIYTNQSLKSLYKSYYNFKWRNFSFRTLQFYLKSIHHYHYHYHYLLINYYKLLCKNQASAIASFIKRGRDVSYIFANLTRIFQNLIEPQPPSS